MNTRPLLIDRMDAWAIHDCLQAAFAGFGGRHETAEPWHGASLLAKTRSALLSFERGDAPPSLYLELSKGELECLDCNVPRTAYQGATALLVRTFHALEEIDFELPLLGNEPDCSDQQTRLTSWRNEDRAGPPIRG